MTEKKVYDLTVDPEFRDLIPPLNEEELKLLEESLVADGCESPLIVWNGVIIDGHNRYAICRKHDIPFSIQEKNFETREEVMLWMLRNQLGRRNLNSYQRSNLALKLEPLLASEAEERQGKRTDLGQNSARSNGLRPLCLARWKEWLIICASGCGQMAIPCLRHHSVVDWPRDV